MGEPAPRPRIERRRRRPSSSPAPPPPPRQWAVIVLPSQSTDGSVDVAAPASASAASGQLVKLSKVPIGHRSHTAEDAESNDRWLCLWEESGDGTGIGITLQTSGTMEVRGDATNSSVEEALTSRFPRTHAIVASDDGAAADSSSSSDANVDGRDTLPEECTSYLQSAMANYWQPRHSPHGSNGRHRTHVAVSREDIERLCQILAPGARSRHYYRRGCPCGSGTCTADAILYALGWDGDGSVWPGERPSMRQPPKDKRRQTFLRLAVVEHTRGAKETTPTTPLTANWSCGLVVPLPPSRRVPLLSITLHPRDNDMGSAIISDALLRACVKRLLVGRIILHSDVQPKGKDTESVAPSGTLSFRSLLSVRVPRNPSSSDSQKYNELEFRVGGVQSAASGVDGDDDRGMSTLFVILPSTRILFQPCEGGKGDAPETDNARRSASSNAPQAQSIAEVPRLPNLLGRHSPMPPHQHLVESLRSIMFCTSHRGRRPPVPRCFLLSGPPGVGKTYSVKKALGIANAWHTAEATPAETERQSVHLVSLRGSELLASSSGGNHAAAARELEGQFRRATSLCQAGDRPMAAVIFLDECDALVSSSIVAATLAVLLDRMEGVVGPNDGDGGGWDRILVAAATNRVDAIPDFLRRPGRLEKEVVVSPPNAEERFGLLKKMIGSSEPSTHDGSALGIDEAGLQKVAEACVGYVAADLSALVRRAAMLCIERLFQHGMSEPIALQRSQPAITTNDLFSAMSDVGASCLRDASLSAPPRTTWDDIAGDAGGAKRALREAIEWPRTRKSAFKALGLSPPRGVLLHGPPGCAKTTLARASAGAAGVAFLSLSPADVYSSSYVGEAEGVVRRAFDLARSAAPCVLFFDEIDAIIGGDSGGSGGGHGMGRGASAEARVLSTFLNEMDGVDGSVEDGVLVLGATNRPFLLDAAILRPGRFDRVIYVPPPDEVGRRAILSMECKKWHAALSAFPSSDATNFLTDTGLSSDGFEAYFDIEILASDDVSGSMTGAEIVGACREAAVQVMQRLMNDPSGANGAFYKQRAGSTMRSLMDELESCLRTKKPLLSNAAVLEEYARFENEHK